MSDAQKIAERFVQLAFDGDDPSPELIVQMTDEFLDAGLREAVEALENLRDTYHPDDGSAPQHVHVTARSALAALKGDTINQPKETSHD